MNAAEARKLSEGWTRTLPPNEWDTKIIIEHAESLIAQACTQGLTSARVYVRTLNPNEIRKIKDEFMCNGFYCRISDHIENDRGYSFKSGHVINLDWGLGKEIDGDKYKDYLERLANYNKYVKLIIETCKQNGEENLIQSELNEAKLHRPHNPYGGM